MSTVVARSDMPVSDLRVLIALLSHETVLAKDLMVPVKIHPSQLFLVLGRLIDQEFIDQLTVPSLGPGQFDRRYYSLTEEGRRVAEEEFELLSLLMREANLRVT
ncbi:hypothetical protein AB0G15_05940 [Streptosporangium sp. NPDC023825]|uniref:hypothetical protein n=1 Tax=Streptosporangium sp. NPDC023825 TaxID=3154909 RepID=UPI003419423C